MLHLMLWEGLVDTRLHRRAHQRLRRAARPRARVHAEATRPQVCGIARPTTSCRPRAGSPARRRGSAPTLSLYCQGLNQSSSGTDKNAALINLHLATGQIGKPGAGPFSLTGQPNAMGGREVGGLANLLVGAPRPGQSRAPRRSRRAVGRGRRAGAARQDARSRCSRPRPTAQIKALWIACTNPAQSMPDQATVRRALRALPSSSCVQEAFATTATCAYADLLLPATTWGEKDGTVTNSERRISRVRAAVPRAGRGARTTGRIARRLRAPARSAAAARRADGRTLFPYDDAEAIWNEHRESTRGRDLDITGLSYAHARTQAPQQWPLPEGAAAGPRAPVRRRRLPHRRRPRALRRAAVRGRWPSRATRAIPFCADHRPAARPVARHEPHRHAGPAVRPRRRAGDRDAPAATWRAAAEPTATWCA